MIALRHLPTLLNVDVDVDVVVIQKEIGDRNGEATSYANLGILYGSVRRLKNISRNH